MEEPLGAQYALQIAVSTLKDRCLMFQQRVSILEEENLGLRVKCLSNEDMQNSLSEMDELKEKITELTEQKSQLQNKIKLVTNENQELWKKLGKLTSGNENLGSNLNQINNSKIQCNNVNHTPLIRSKTFTQDEPHTKALQKNLEETEKISVELEDISLKISNSFAKGNAELESLRKEITQMQYTDNLITDSFGFCYDDEFDDGFVEDFKIAVDELHTLRKLAKDQQTQLNLAFIYLSKIKANDKKKKKLADKGTVTEEITNNTSNATTGTPKNLQVVMDSLGNETFDQLAKVCPICGQNFYKETPFTDFQNHVESHFITEDNFEMI